MGELASLHTNKSGFPVPFPEETMLDLDSIRALGTFTDEDYKPTGFTELMRGIIDDYLLSEDTGPLATPDYEREDSVQCLVRPTDEQLTIMEQKFPGLDRYSLVAGVAVTAVSVYRYTITNHQTQPPQILTVHLGEEPGRITELFRDNIQLGLQSF